MCKGVTRHCKDQIDELCGHLKTKLSLFQQNHFIVVHSELMVQFAFEVDEEGCFSDSLSWKSRSGVLVVQFAFGVDEKFTSKWRQEQIFYSMRLVSM